jgi:hypothetical protein
VAAGLLTAGFNGWLRLGLTAVHWQEYSSLGVQPGVWYLALTGFLSGLVYTPAGVTALLPGTIWKKITLGLLISGLALHWIDRICFARSLEAQTALPFSLTAVTLLTAAAICLLFGNSFRSLTAHGK